VYARLDVPLAVPGRTCPGSGHSRRAGLGGIAWLAGWHEVADWCWIAGTLVAVVPAVWWVLVALRRPGGGGSDSGLLFGGHAACRPVSQVKALDMDQVRTKIAARKAAATA
jgi:hypothetical protein